MCTGKREVGIDAFHIHTSLGTGRLLVCREDVICYYKNCLTQAFAWSVLLSLFSFFLFQLASSSR